MFVTRETHLVSVILESAHIDKFVVKEVRARNQPQLVLQPVLIVDPIAHDSVVLPGAVPRYQYHSVEGLVVVFTPLLYLFFDRVPYLVLR